MTNARLSPLPNLPARATVLDLGAKVEDIDGRWIELNDAVRYRLEASSFNDRSVTMRSNEVTNALVSGAFATSALQENVTETVSVYVYGSSEYDLLMNVQALELAFTQPAYRFLKRIGDASEYWLCLPAGYRVNRTRELTHATMALFTVSIPRRPELDRVITAPDELF